MKKLITLVLTAIAAIGLLTGCGSKENSTSLSIKETNSLEVTCTSDQSLNVLVTEGGTVLVGENGIKYMMYFVPDAEDMEAAVVGAYMSEVPTDGITVELDNGGSLIYKATLDTQFVEYILQSYLEDVSIEGNEVTLTINGETYSLEG